MKFKVLLVIEIIFIVLLGSMVFNLYKESFKEKDEVEKISKIENESLGRYVTDECINEWRDYSKTVQEEFAEASQALSDVNRQYILRAEDEFVKVYYINEKNEEILYKVTDISTRYLEDDDITRLKEGIEVKGIQELNKLLEDFE